MEVDLVKKRGVKTIGYYPCELIDTVDSRV